MLLPERAQLFGCSLEDLSTLTSNQAMETGSTPLMVAAEQAPPAVVRCLREHGANINN
jgi:ankyrin repeat protein